MTVHHNCQHLRPWDAAQRFSPATSCDGWYTLINGDILWSCTAAGFTTMIGISDFEREISMLDTPGPRVYHWLIVMTPQKNTTEVVIRFAWRWPSSTHGAALGTAGLLLLACKAQLEGRRKHSWHEMMWFEMNPHLILAYFSHFQFSVQVHQHVSFTKERRIEQGSRAGYLW